MSVLLSLSMDNPIKLRFCPKCGLASILEFTFLPDRTAGRVCCFSVDCRHFDFDFKRGVPFDSMLRAMADRWNNLDDLDFPAHPRSCSYDVDFDCVVDSINLDPVPDVQLSDRYRSTLAAISSLFGIAAPDREVTE